MKLSLLYLPAGENPESPNYLELEACLGPNGLDPNRLSIRLHSCVGENSEVKLWFSRENIHKLRDKLNEFLNEDTPATDHDEYQQLIEKYR